MSSGDPFHIFDASTTTESDNASPPAPANPFDPLGSTPKQQEQKESSSGDIMQQIAGWGADNKTEQEQVKEEKPTEEKPSLMAQKGIEISDDLVEEAHAQVAGAGQ